MSDLTFNVVTLLLAAIGAVCYGLGRLHQADIDRKRWVRFRRDRDARLAELFDWAWPDVESSSSARSHVRLMPSPRLRVYDQDRDGDGAA